MLSKYTSNEDKDQNYLVSHYIHTKDELDEVLKGLNQGRYYYRGVNNASFKMYASSQRGWDSQNSALRGLGQQDYRSVIQCLLEKTASLKEVRDYMSAENVDYNEVFILALMQHYGLPSPFIDFSNTLEKALFFACDAAGKQDDDKKRELDDYVSLYYIGRNVDWMYTNVQTVVKRGLEGLDAQLVDLARKCNFTQCELKRMCESEVCKIRTLQYSQFKPEDVTFLTIGGPSLGVVKVAIPSVNFSCEYNIINRRLLEQDGFFVFNNTLDKPLVEIMNGEHTRYFNCINIHKSLVHHIESEYLAPKGICRESMYCEGDEVSDKLKEAIGTLKSDLCL
jgi:hypothetical protein